MPKISVEIAYCGDDGVWQTFGGVDAEGQLTTNGFEKVPPSKIPLLLSLYGFASRLSSLVTTTRLPVEGEAPATPNVSLTVPK